MKKLIIFLFSVLLLGSCNQTKFISNGVTDTKPLIFEDEYQCKNLKELNLEGSAFWGIPKSTELSKDAKHNSGRIISFNGVRIMGSSKLLPILGMITYTAVVGTSLSAVFGLKNEASYYEFGLPVYKPRLPLVPAMILSVPIAGALNNLTFSNSALGVAGSVQRQPAQVLGPSSPLVLGNHLGSFPRGRGHLLVVAAAATPAANQAQSSKRCW